MAETAGKVDIEDVLVSVRKLLRHGLSDIVAETAPKPAAEPPAVPERLVLTPALRVAPPQTMPRASAPSAPPAADEVPDDLPDDLPADPPDEMTHEDVASDDITHEDMAHDDLASDGGAHDGGAHDAEPHEAAAPPDGPDPHRDYFATDRSRLESIIGELEAAVTRQPDEWEPDGSEVEQTFSFDSMAAMPLLDFAEDAETVEPAAPEQTAETTADEAATTEQGADEDATAQEPTAPELSEDPPAADDALDDGTLDLAAEEADALRYDELADDPLHDAEIANLDESPDACLDDGATLDEASLRGLVADVLRQELQGELGDRLSSNIRKLVRREIARFVDSRGG